MKNHMNPIQIRNIDHVVLRVGNLEPMLVFYRDVLGCGVVREDRELGLIQLKAGRSLIDLVPVSGRLGAEGGAAPGTEGRNMDHLCLRLGHYAEGAIISYLEDAGVRVGEAGQRFGAEGMGPSLYISDPEGNTVELKGPPGKTVSSVAGSGPDK